jgi:hypothetical protein
MAAIAIAATSRRQLIGFYVSAVIGALLFGGLFVGVPTLITTWFTPDPEGHRIHNLTHGITSGFLLTVAFVAQLRSPERRIAAMQQVLIVGALLIVPFVAFTVVMPPTEMAAMVVAFMALAAVAVVVPAVLHPARAELFRRGRTSLPLLAFAAVAGLGAAYYAAVQLGVQFGAPTGEIHAKSFHYGGAAFTALGIAACGLIAALRTSGWRIVAWSAGIGAALFGSAGIAYPDALSSLGPSAGAAAILIGAAFVALAERERGR